MMIIIYYWMKVMRMSRPELLCGIPVHSFRLQILVSLNSLHGICFQRRSQPNNAKGSQLVKVMCMSQALNSYAESQCIHFVYIF